MSRHNDWGSRFQKSLFAADHISAFRLDSKFKFENQLLNSFFKKNAQTRQMSFDEMDNILKDTERSFIERFSIAIHFVELNKNVQIR